jgi:hypothetical protein
MVFLFSFVIVSQISGNIIVRPDTGQIPISPFVFSSGDEMSHSFSPLDQTQPLIAATKPPLLRIGGIGAEYFDWEADDYSGIFYVDFVDTAIVPLPVNFGIDSILRLCEDINAEPILTVNMHTADTGLARRMVEYANGDTTTPMGALRAQRGHPEPYNVTLWSLGNEPDIVHLALPVPPWGYWTFLRHFGIPFANWHWSDSVYWEPEDFANLVPLYVSTMESASPIPLEFIYSIAQDPSWVRPIIEPNINLIDYLDVHYYPGALTDTIVDTLDYIDWLSRTDTITPAEEFIEVFKDSLDAIGATSIEPVVLEFNSGIIMTPDPLWWNYLTGLFIADCIGHWMHRGVTMAAVYSIHEGSPESSDYPYFGVVRGDTISRRMPSYVLELYNTYFGDTLIYAFSDHKNTGYGIECWASKRSSDGKYVFMVINKTLDTTYTMTMHVKDSLALFRLRNITNNAPMSAPFNGTTGIEDHGTISPDSIRNGWTYLTLSFEPKSVSLFEVSTWIGVTDMSEPAHSEFFMPTILRRGTTVSLPLGTYTLYSLTGQEISQWNNTEVLTIPHIPAGIYFLNIQNKKFKKIIIF